MKLFILATLFAFNTYAAPIGDIKITANVVKENSDEVVIKAENGEFKLPRAAVKNKEVKKGKEVELYVDAAAYEKARAQFVIEQNKVTE